MQQFNVKSILFNAAAGIVVLSTVIFMLRSLFVAEVIPPCSARYPSPTEFTLDNGNGPMSPVQLVGMIGTTQRGIYRNAKVVRVRDTSGKHALKVALRPDGEDARTTGEGNGIAFQWSPAGMAGATAACLSYSVYLPEKFDFGGGGVLPGLYAGAPETINESSDGKRAVAQRLVWRNNGRANLYAQLPGYEANGGAYLHQDGIAFPSGRWVKVEQEIKLNDLGKANGLSRLYLDGKIEIEKQWIEWRKNGKLTLSGVHAEVTYAMPRRDLQPPKETAIYVTPLQLRWR
ncbi:MAG: hypothetical protein KJ587_09225 [Alphaproteobacteria bacterium]|nr:hypothetical protein [Alphaproteobacteria bacterium]